MSGEFTKISASALRRFVCGCLFPALACLFGSTAWAQFSSPVTVIQAPRVYGVDAIGGVPNAVAMGDFNGDGLVDFAVVEYFPANPSRGFVQVFIGKGDGSFSDSYGAASYTIGNIAGQPYVTNHNIAVGHFNGLSSSLGIAVAVNSASGCPSGGVVLLYGKGGGMFQQPTCLANPSGVTSVAVADFDNDGFDDIAVSNASGAAAGTITVYLNNQSGGFTNSGSFTASVPVVGGTLYGTIVAANNSLRSGDGPSIALLASAGPFTQYVTIFENTNGHNFLPAAQPLAISGNGLTDIAWTNPPGSGPASLVGIGGYGSNGGLQSIPISFTFLGAYLGPITTLQTGSAGLAIAVADFDGNGIPDFAYLDINQNLNISLNPGSTTSSHIGPFGPAGQGVAAALSPGLGGKWVVVDSGVFTQPNPLFAQVPEARSIAVYLVDPTMGQPGLAPLYAQSSTLTTGTQRAFAVADFNGVGVPDVAVLGQDEVNFDATVSIFQNAYKTATPPGYATPPTVIDLGTLLGAGSYGTSPGYALAAGSFRAFDPDIALVTSQGITLLENQGANAQGPFNFTLAPNCQGFSGASANNCYLGNDPNYPGLSFSSNSPRPPIIAVDVNGDGYQDVVVAYPENCNANSHSAIYVFISNGDGTFQTPIYIPSPVVNPVGLAAGKLLGNSVPDLVVVNGGEVCSGTQAITGPLTFVGAALVPNKGAAGFGTPQKIFPPTSGVVAPSVSAVAVADMNKDTALDLVLSAADGIHVLLNNLLTPGMFADQGPVPLYNFNDIITNAAQIDIADLNRDGNLDVAAAIGGIVYFFEGDGTGALAGPIQGSFGVLPSGFASGPNSNQIRAIDVNGDGTADVLVNNSLGFSVLYNATPPPPNVTSVTPGSGPTVGGETVMISGTGFQSGATVQFGGTYATLVTFNSAASLSVVVPALAAGPEGVTVVNPDGRQGVLVNGFLVLSPPPPPPSPQISSVTPNTGFQGQQGLLVTILGANFAAGSTTVTVGGAIQGVTVQSFTVNSAMNGTAVLNIDPFTALGSYDVVVSVAGAAFPATLSSGFTVTTGTVPINIAETVIVTDAPFVAPPYTVTGIVAPVANYSAGSLGFVGVTPGQTVTQTLTVASVGLRSLAISAEGITQDASNSFSVTHVLCSDGTSSITETILSGGECTLTISYTPPASGTPNGAITFTNNAALSNLTSTASGPNFTQTLTLSSTVATTASPADPPTTIPISITEPIQVTDTPVVSNTEGGTNVTVTPVDTTTGTTPVTLTFANVTQPGVTSLTTSPAGPPPPTGFQLGNPGVYYNLSTTAIYTGPVTICINYAGILFTQLPHLYHYQNGAWMDVTTSVTTTNMVVCGTTTSFSPFALFQPSAFPTTTAISAAGVSYGTPGSVTVSVSSTGGTVTGNVSLSVDGGTASTLALSNGSAVFNLAGLTATTHTLAASFAAQGNFTASSGSGTLTVALAPLTVTAYNASRAYGGANPAFSATDSGFVNGDTAASLSGTLVCTTAATASSPVGSYPVNCNGVSSSNYAIIFAPGTLTITPAALTIAANNATRMYGGANPTLTASYAGFVNGDTASVLVGALSCSTSATPASPVGTYPVNCGGQSASNYSITYLPGKLAVTPAKLTITANNLTKTFDAPNPTLTWTASGFVNGNNTSVITTSPTCTTTATTTSPVGNYPVTCSGAAAANYTFTYVPGSLTVTCHYVSVGLSPSTVAEGGLITVSWTLRSCANTTQTVAFSFTLSGPVQPDSCSPTKSEMFSLPPFALKPNTLQSLSFPFKIPKGICAGTYSTTATTAISGKVVDTSSTSLTITAH